MDIFVLKGFVSLISKTEIIISFSQGGCEEPMRSIIPNLKKLPIFNYFWPSQLFLNGTNSHKATFLNYEEQCKF